MPTLLKSRDRFSVKGLGECRLLQVLPTMGTAFDSAGYLENTDFKDILETEIIKDENGNITNVLEKSRAIGLDTMLQQTSIDEINLLRQSSGKAYAVQYYGLANPGMFQYFLIPQAILDAGVPLPFKTGKRTLPLKALGVLKETTPETPQYYLAEAKARLYLDKLQLWVNPRDLSVANRGTSRLDDISGFQRHGTLNSDYASIWTTGTNPESKLTFDGVNDQCDFGNILNDDGVSDVLFEIWVRILTTDGTRTRILTKKSTDAYDSSTAGFGLIRDTDNNLHYGIGDGTNLVYNTLFASSVLQNVWTHVAFAIDRNGNATPFKNGAAGTPASVAAVGNAVNSQSLYLGRGSAFGNIDIGMLRVFNYGAGGLPSNITAIVASHYNAEKSYYGL